VRGHEVLQVDSFQHCVVEAFELLGNVAGKVVHRKFNGKPKIVASNGQTISAHVDGFTTNPLLQGIQHNYLQAVALDS